MALDFPVSPTNGQRYPVSGDPSWTWNDSNQSWDFNRQQVDHVGKKVVTDSEVEDASIGVTKFDLDYLSDSTSTPNTFTDWETIESVSASAGVWLVTAGVDIEHDILSSIELRIYCSTASSNDATRTFSLKKTAISHASLATVLNLTSSGTIIVETRRTTGVTSTANAVNLEAVRIG